MWQYLLPGLSALAGGLGNRSSTQRNRGSFNNQSRNYGTNFTSVTPEYDFFQDKLRGNIFSKYMDLINKDPDLTGYRNTQVGNMNRLADVQRRRAIEEAGARGVGGPALNTSLDNIDAQRFSGITQLDNQIPLLARDLNMNLLNQATGFFSALPMRTSTENTFDQFTNQSGTQEGQVQMPGNVAGGITGNLANMLAFLYGQGAFNNMNKNNPMNINI